LTSIEAGEVLRTVASVNQAFVSHALKPLMTYRLEAAPTVSTDSHPVRQPSAQIACAMLR